MVRSIPEHIRPSHSNKLQDHRICLSDSLSFFSSSASSLGDTFVSPDTFELKKKYSWILEETIFYKRPETWNGFKQQLICFSANFFFYLIPVLDIYCTSFLFHIFVQNPISKAASERDAPVLLRFLYFMSSCGKWGRSYGMTNMVRQYSPSNAKAP